VTLRASTTLPQLLGAGASGFVLKDAPADQLLTAIRVVAQGEALLAPSITRRPIAEYARRPRAAGRPETLDELTERELDVMRLMREDFPTQKWLST
jgi:DNA-binding NarL/FixJ family response regulator